MDEKNDPVGDKIPVIFIDEGGMGSGFVNAGKNVAARKCAARPNAKFYIVRIAANSTSVLFVPLIFGGAEDKMDEICRTLRPRDIWRFPLWNLLKLLLHLNALRHPLNTLLSVKAFFESTPLHKIAERYMTPDVLKRFFSQSVELAASRVHDATRETEMHYSHAPGNRYNGPGLLKAQRQSTALQGCFPPEDGYSDGVKANLPVHEAALTKVESGKPICFFSGCNLLKRDRNGLGGKVLERFAYTAEMLRDEITRLKIRIFDKINQNVQAWEALKAEAKERGVLDLIEKHRSNFSFAECRYIEWHVITNSEPISEPSFYDFTNDELINLFDTGYRAALEKFETLGWITIEEKEQMLRERNLIT